MEDYCHRCVIKLVGDYKLGTHTHVQYIRTCQWYMYMSQGLLIKHFHHTNPSYIIPSSHFEAPFCMAPTNGNNHSSILISCPPTIAGTLPTIIFITEQAVKRYT